MKKIASPLYFKKIFPLEEKEKKFIEQSRRIAKNIFSRKDKRFVLIIGPCSIHDTNAALVYAKKLKNIVKDVSSKFFLVMRFFVEKSRTKNGWKGLLHDPFLDGSAQIEQGLHLARKNLLALTAMQIPIAMEFVDPFFAPYLSDLITWGFIGARTSSSPTHRYLASSFPFPIGIKNTLDGCVDTTLNSIFTVRQKHILPLIDDKGFLSYKNTSGNTFAHLVLRGGRKKNNFQKKEIQKALKKMKEKNIFSPILIDCSHGNCHYDHTLQKKCFTSVFRQIKKGNASIFGIMLESFLKEGCQPIASPISSLIYGQSITDSCIDLSSTKELILWAYTFLANE